MRVQAVRGYIGVREDLKPGTEIISGHNLELRIVVIGRATEEQARQNAAEMGHELVAVPGELFYECEITTAPVSSNN